MFFNNKTNCSNIFKMCHVYADPEATITWYKNTLLLQKHPRYRHLLPPLHHPHKHELVVESVSIEDFANYTCLATNNMGKADGAIELRGMMYCQSVTSDILTPSVRHSNVVDRW